MSFPRIPITTKNKNKPSEEQHKNIFKKKKTIDNNKHYSLPFNNPILQIHNSNK